MESRVHPEPIAWRITAWLPNGDRFWPAAPDVACCLGPDGSGVCPRVVAGHAPACEFATWFVETPTHRPLKFQFRSTPHVCPLVMLDPVARTGEFLIG